MTLVCLPPRTVAWAYQVARLAPETSMKPGSVASVNWPLPGGSPRTQASVNLTVASNFSNARRRHDDVPLESLYYIAFRDVRERPATTISGARPAASGLFPSVRQSIMFAPRLMA